MNTSMQTDSLHTHPLKRRQIAGLVVTASGFVVLLFNGGAIL